MKTPKEKLVEQKTTKPERKSRGKTHVMTENQDGVFEVPQESLEQFQRAQIQKLEEIGDFVHGYYEGIQPVNYGKTQTIGYIMLLRQGQNSTDPLYAINCGYDIRRWLQESGFDGMLGEYIKITLDSFVDTSNGKLAPMKQYRFSYTQSCAKKLQTGGQKTLAQLQAKYDDGIKLSLAAKNEKAVEAWEDDQDND